MRHRRFQVLALVAVLAGAFAGIARALDFDDEDPHPPRSEIGEIYNYKIGAHAGCIPYHFVVDSGQLPPGLKLSDLDYTTGLVSGVPTESGTWSAWLSLHDCAGKSAQTLFTFEVWPRSWGIKTTSLPSAVAGSSYTVKLQAGDHPVTAVNWKVTKGTLPAGLTLGADGTISGTPTAAGSSTFTITATSSDSDSIMRTDSKQFTVNVVALTAAASRTLGEVGVPFSSTLIATGGQTPYAWTAPKGLPPGLDLGADGVVSGIPTRAGTYTVTIHLAEAGGAAKDFQVTLVVRARLAIAAARLPVAAAGRAYRAQIHVRGGAAGLRWRIAGGALPHGVKLDARTGKITGRPASAGTFRVRVSVRDALGATATKTFVLSVR
jgi:large repetitive protein